MSILLGRFCTCLLEESLAVSPASRRLGMAERLTVCHSPTGWARLNRQSEDPLSDRDPWRVGRGGCPVLSQARLGHLKSPSYSICSSLNMVADASGQSLPSPCDGGHEIAKIDIYATSYLASPGSFLGAYA